MAVVTDGREVRVRITGNGIDVDRVVPPAVVGSVLRLVLSGEVGSGVVEPAHGGTPGSGPQSIAELLREANAQRNPDRIVTMATYLKSNGSAEFSRGDIRQLFREAGEPEPRNFARDWAWTVRNGWIAGSDKAGYYLTRSGQLAVESRFGEDVVKKTRGKASRRRRVATQESAIPPGYQ